jgi:hypothetical protein
VFPRAVEKALSEAAVLETGAPAAHATEPTRCLPSVTEAGAEATPLPPVLERVGDGRPDDAALTPVSLSVGAQPGETSGPGGASVGLEGRKETLQHEKAASEAPSEPPIAQPFHEQQGVTEWQPPQGSTISSPAALVRGSPIFPVVADTEGQAGTSLMDTHLASAPPPSDHGHAHPSCGSPLGSEATISVRAEDSGEHATPPAPAASGQPATSGPSPTVGQGPTPGGMGATLTSEPPITAAERGQDPSYMPEPRPQSESDADGDEDVSDDDGALSEGHDESTHSDSDLDTSQGRGKIRGSGRGGKGCKVASKKGRGQKKPKPGAGAVTASALGVMLRKRPGKGSTRGQDGGTRGKRRRSGKKTLDAAGQGAGQGPEQAPGQATEQGAEDAPGQATEQGAEDTPGQATEQGAEDARAPEPVPITPAELGTCSSQSKHWTSMMRWECSVLVREVGVTVLCELT